MTGEDDDVYDDDDDDDYDQEEEAIDDEGGLGWSLGTRDPIPYYVAVCPKMTLDFIDSCAIWDIKPVYHIFKLLLSVISPKLPKFGWIFYRQVWFQKFVWGDYIFIRCTK